MTEKVTKNKFPNCSLLLLLFESKRKKYGRLVHWQTSPCLLRGVIMQWFLSSLQACVIQPVTTGYSRLRPNMAEKVTKNKIPNSSFLLLLFESKRKKYGRLVHWQTSPCLLRGVITQWFLSLSDEKQNS